MRQVFSSPRLENVERVAQLLQDAGIETRVTHGRSYRGGLRGNFSYREGAEAKPVPAVWVVRSEDQPKARALLREQGLLDSTRADTGYRLPTFRTEDASAEADPGRRRLFRIKLGLLVVIVLVLGLTWFSQLDDGQVPVPARPAPVLAALPPSPGRVIPLSQCPAADIPRLAIHGYRATASGRGTITLERSLAAGATPVAETYEVSRGSKGWRVIELL